MKCFVLHSCFAAFYIVAWKGLLLVDYHAKNQKELASTAELSARFLTNWNFVCQTVLFFAYLVNDVLRLTNVLLNFQIKMKNKLDFYFYSIVGPMSIFVPVVFWGLFLSDKDLVSVFPDAKIDVIMAPWVNHSVHTVVAVNVILHAYFNKVSLFKLRELLPPVAAYNLVYVVCIYVTYYEKQVWVYGFLRKLEEPFRVGSLLLLTIWAVVLGFIFNRVNNWHCGRSKLPYSGADQKRRD